VGKAPSHLVQPFAVLGALEAGLDYDFFSEILLNPAPEQQHTHE